MSHFGPSTVAHNHPLYLMDRSLSFPMTVHFRPNSFYLDENNETPVLTGHTTPGVVSSIVSSEALQADLLQAGEGLRRPEEVSEDLPAHEDDRDAYEDRGDDNEDLDDNPEAHEENNEIFDSDWPKQNSGNEPITVSSQDSSQEGVYEVRYDAEDDHEDNPDDREEPEVISDSDSEEEHEDYPIDRFIPIQDDTDDPEGNDRKGYHDHPSVEIVEPEGLNIYQEGEYEDEYEDDEENEDYEDSDEEQRHPSMWQRDRTAPPPRRISSSSDEVICLDSD